MTQGSSCLATLGFGTESRWDSRTARDSASRSRFAARDGWMFPPQHCMRKHCGSQTSQTRAPNNPKGIGASSPRLACTAYPGCAFGNRINANGVVAEVSARAGTDGPQPRCGCGCFSDNDPG